MLSAAGCVGVDMAIIASTATAGAQVGYEASRSGKINLAIMDNSEEVHQAAIESLNDLSLEIYKDEDHGEGDWTLHFRDNNERYRLIIDQRTDTLTRVQVNVGWFGPTSIGQLVLKRLFRNLADDADAGDLPTPSLDR